MFGIVAFLFMQYSFSFLESSAIFTDLSFSIVITAGETKQFSVVLSAFSRCPFSINFFNSFFTMFWKCMGTGLPFCWIGFVSFFNWMSIVRSFIVWLFLKRFSNSLKIFSPFSLAVMFRMIFVSRFPCSPISSLSSQSNPRRGCVFLFSVIRMGSTVFVFFRFDFYHRFPLEFDWIFVYINETFWGRFDFFWVDNWRDYRHWRACVNNEFYWLSMDQ